MKIKITKPGIYGKNGEIPVGEIIDVKDEPTGIAGRYEVVSGDTVAVTNPAEGAVGPGGPGGSDMSADTRQAILKGAALQMDAEDFNDDGRPDVRALNAELAEDVKPFSAAERDQLWPSIAEEVKAERA